MATTTTNFGWDIPQSTDLVKDGATAIAALGQDIDTSMAELKGGTTGQILSKTSNTDMDFTWINNDQGDITGVTAGTGISGGGTSGTVTITNDMATTIDAKGDLIGGTGADTYARLAVGTNGQVLTADSTTATGLKWASATPSYTWSSWTPTWTNLTIGNGTQTANYVTVGDIVFIELQLVWGSTTSASGNISFSLPVNAATTFSTTPDYYGYAGTGLVWDNSASGNYTSVGVVFTATTGRIMILDRGTFANYVTYRTVSNTVPVTLATSDQFILNMWYRKA